MDELIKQVAERAGIDASQAEKAIDAVLEQLQTRLPGPLGQQRGLVEGKDLDIGSLGEQLKGLGLGGLFGR